MDEDKKSESSWEEAEQVGPYRLEEQVPQDDYSRGPLYRATHETSGARALVRESAARDEGSAEPVADMRVRLISSASRGYDAMEVEQTPWSVAPDRQSVESLVSTLEDAHKVVERMAHAYSAPSEPRPQRHLGLAWGGVAAVFALAFTLGRLVPMSQSPSGSVPVVSVAPAPMSQEVQTEATLPPKGISFRDVADGGLSIIAYPFPSKPYKGQKRPPCTPKIEMEINGGCWVPHALKPPCPEELHEYQGQCFTVAVTAQPLPQSVGP